MMVSEWWHDFIFKSCTFNAKRGLKHSHWLVKWLNKRSTWPALLHPSIKTPAFPPEPRHALCSATLSQVSRRITTALRRVCWVNRWTLAQTYTPVPRDGQPVSTAQGQSHARWGQSKAQTKSKSCKDLHNNAINTMSARTRQMRIVADVCNRKSWQLML